MLSQAIMHRFINWRNITNITNKWWTSRNVFLTFSKNTNRKQYGIIRNVLISHRNTHLACWETWCSNVCCTELWRARTVIKHIFEFAQSHSMRRVQHQGGCVRNEFREGYKKYRLGSHGGQSEPLQIDMHLKKYVRCTHRTNEKAIAWVFVNMFL